MPGMTRHCRRRLTGIRVEIDHSLSLATSIWIDEFGPEAPLRGKKIIASALSAFFATQGIEGVSMGMVRRLERCNCHFV